MSEILEITNGNVKIGNEDGSVSDMPIASLRFPNPKVGDNVRIYQDQNSAYVTLANPIDVASVDQTGERRINKVAYVLITLFFAPLGVHRFMRGQVGLGILMLLFGWWITMGIWPLIDFIISLVKLSAYTGDDYIFTRDGRFTK